MRTIVPKVPWEPAVFLIVVVPYALYELVAAYTGQRALHATMANTAVVIPLGSLLVFFWPKKFPSELKSQVNTTESELLFSTSKFWHLLPITISLRLSEMDYFVGVAAFFMLAIQFSFHNSRPELYVHPEEFRTYYFAVNHMLLGLSFRAIFVILVVEMCNRKTFIWPLLRGSVMAAMGYWFLVVSRNLWSETNCLVSD